MSFLDHLKTTQSPTVSFDIPFLRGMMTDVNTGLNHCAALNYMSSRLRMLGSAVIPHHFLKECVVDRKGMPRMSCLDFTFEPEAL